MSSPLFDKLEGNMSNPQMNIDPRMYSDIMTRAQQLAKVLPPNFNPQSMVESMLQSSQVSQDRLNWAMQIANSLLGRHPF